MNVLLRTLSGIRRRGVLYSIGIVINRITPASLFRFRIFDVLEVAASDELQPRSDSEATAIEVIRCENEDQLQQAERLTFTVTNPSDPAAVFQIPWVAMQESECVAGIWTTRQSFDETELGLRIELPNDGVWLYAANVGKPFRRQGIYRRLLQSVLVQTAGPAESPARFYVAINPLNRPSCSAHRRFVRRKVGTVLAVKVLGVAACLPWGVLTAKPAVAFASKQSPARLQIPDNVQ